MASNLAWSGNCRECFAIFVVAPHDETSEAGRERIAAGPNDWEAFASCFVCDGTIDWNGSDPLPITIR